MQAAVKTLIKTVATDVTTVLKADPAILSNAAKLKELIENKLIPNFSFARMTQLAMGRNWAKATPEQQTALTKEFQTLLVRTYSGALAQVQDQTVELKPMRNGPDDKEVVVKTEVKGRGDPIQLDYRLAQTPGGWKVYDINVLGVWLVENYRNSFSQEIGSGGIDGLIGKLAARNKGASPAPKS